MNTSTYWTNDEHKHQKKAPKKNNDKVMQGLDQRLWAQALNESTMIGLLNV